MMALPFSLRPLIIAAVSVVLLAGCGRRGPLEAPPGATPVPQTTSAEDERTPGDKPVTLSPISKPAGKKTPIAAPKRPFILDAIL